MVGSLLGCCDTGGDGVGGDTVDGFCCSAVRARMRSKSDPDTPLNPPSCPGMPVSLPPLDPVAMAFTPNCDGVPVKSMDIVVLVVVACLCSHGPDPEIWTLRRRTRTRPRGPGRGGRTVGREGSDDAGRRAVGGRSAERRGAQRGAES